MIVAVGRACKAKCASVSPGGTTPHGAACFILRGSSTPRSSRNASGVFASVEVNGTFYSLQRPTTFQKWYEATPPGFVFAVKGSRYITHLLRLKEVEPAIANFFASGVLCLREKLGPILWQLPPQTQYDPERLAAFFELLPRTLGEAVRVGRKHDERVAGRSALSVPRALAGQALRYALEVRHPSFCTAEYAHLLRRYDIANCVADSAKRFPSIGDVTSDFVYVRLHGSTKLYYSGYSARELTEWAARIQAWTSGKVPPTPGRVDRSARPRSVREVFVYFDNDAKVKAPFDARNLMKILDKRRSGDQRQRASARGGGSLRAARA